MPRQCYASLWWTSTTPAEWGLTTPQSFGVRHQQANDWRINDAETPLKMRSMMQSSAPFSVKHTGRNRWPARASDVDKSMAISRSPGNRSRCGGTTETTGSGLWLDPDINNSTSPSARSLISILFTIPALCSLPNGFCSSTAEEGIRSHGLP